MALVGRDYLNNPSVRSIMAEAGWDIGEVISMSAKSTSGYGMPELYTGMVAAVALNTFGGGYAGIAANSSYMPISATSTIGLPPQSGIPTT